MKPLSKDQQRSRELFSQLSPREKISHIWLYFKWCILLGVAVLAILISCVYNAITAKETVLYVGYLNASVGEAQEERLHGAYLDTRDLDPKDYELVFFRDLYLSSDPSAENHQYAYTSRMKLVATINAQQLDVVLMNREAYDLMSGNGYLLDLGDLFGNDPEIAPLLTANTVILEDNAMEYDLNQAEEYYAITEDAVNGLNLSEVPLLRQAGFSSEVYAGIVANTPRLSDCVDWIGYLIDAE